MASQYAQEQQQQPQQQQPAVVATPAVAPVVTAASHGFPTFASLWVGDLDPNITETQLCELFQEYGQISTIKLCKDNVTHQSLCYAYVNFYNAEDAERARLALNHKMLGKREMRIMKSQRDPSVRRQNVGNLFVKNLPRQFEVQISRPPSAKLVRSCPAKLFCSPTLVTPCNMVLCTSQPPRLLKRLSSSST